MKMNKINILILILLLFSCDNPLDTDSDETQNLNNDPCSIYIQEIDCIDINEQQCQWITDLCVSSDYYSCTINYGGLIDDCGICSGGITNIIPNSDKDICKQIRECNPDQYIFTSAEADHDNICALITECKQDQYIFTNKYTTKY